LAPPHAITPEKVITALSHGGQGGPALSPPAKNVSFLFCTMVKGILQSPTDLFLKCTGEKEFFFNF
jgi:hypothetical protein